MGNPAVDSAYYDWLLKQINYDLNDHEIGCGYDLILERLFVEPFIWTIPNDDNRAEDGIALRSIFMASENWNSMPLEGNECSVLEMLIAFAMRIEDDIMWNGEENRTEKWFWIMMENLGFDDMYDIFYDASYVDTKLDEFLNRKYENSVLFPLSRKRTHTTKKAKKVELWSQAQAYFMDYYGY